MPGQVAGASAVGLGGLAGLAEVGDQRLALFHLEGVLRLLQRLAEGAQLGGQAAVEGVDHAALPLLQPKHPLFPAQAHGLRQAPPLKGGVVRPLGVAGIKQPRVILPQTALGLRYEGQVQHKRRFGGFRNAPQQQNLKRRVLRVSICTHLGDVQRGIGLNIHRDDLLHGKPPFKKTGSPLRGPPVDGG